MQLFLLFAALFLVTTANLTCPPRSSSLPEYVQLTRGDGACGYIAHMGPNEHNDSYLDVYLEGNEEGWVAVGFSKNQMANSDVIGCKRVNDSSTVGVYNTWNDQRPPNMIDPTQDGMCNYESSFTDGRFSCYFSRYHGVINEGYDYDLKDNYYFLLGCSANTNAETDGFAYHNPHTPAITSQRYNAFTFNGTIPAADKPTFERRMIRAHGIFMVIAYPLLMVTAAFFAAWMKPTLPKLWFPIHVGLMISSLAVGLLAFMLVFIANKDNPTPGIINLKDCGAKTTHFIFGIAVVALQVLNPIIALLRCKPNSPNRWIFNIIHGGGIGLLIELLALTNIALGAIIFQSNCSKLTSNNIMLYLYIGWCAMLITVQGFLYIYFTVRTFKGDYESAPMLVKIYFKFIGIQKYESINADDDTPTNENKIRYAVLCFQFGSTLLISVIFILFIAVDNFI